ncbi:integrase arm-type DNA-binding domain-containing protein [Salmonella enterica]|nr:integrase arm-type DNA-binding domain-containing protein [Salmonella enterica]
MGRTTKPLSSTEVKAAKATNRDAVLYDGDGLELLVKAGSNSKLWRFRYYRPLSKKRAMVSFGPYPAVSLADARRLRDDARVLLARDIDPQEYKKEQAPAQTVTRGALPCRWWMGAGMISPPGTAAATLYRCLRT